MQKTDTPILFDTSHIFLPMTGLIYIRKEKQAYQQESQKHALIWAALF